VQLSSWVARSMLTQRSAQTLICDELFYFISPLVSGRLSMLLIFTTLLGTHPMVEQTMEESGN